MFFIRHAERMDRSSDLNEKEKAVKYKTDIPLSVNGVNQAREAVKEFSSELKCKKLLIIASPYYRCLQTAEIFLEHLSKSHEIHQNTIFVEEQFREIEFSKIIMQHYYSLKFFNFKNIVKFKTKFNSIPGLVKHPFHNPGQHYSNEEF